MSKTANVGSETMSKKQKNLQLDEGLCELVESMQRCSGASLTRIVSAALIQYFFTGFNDEDPNEVPGPEPWWMKRAFALERGECTVDDIPTNILNDCILEAEWWYRYQDRPTEESKSERERYRKLAHMFRKRKIYWDRAIKDFGGKREAIVHLLEGRVPKPHMLEGRVPKPNKS